MPLTAIPATPEAPVFIIGGGPAGLTAAYELVRRHTPTLVVERGAEVGGLARTVRYKGFRFDIGGHRFFTKMPRVEALWREMLGADLLTRPRLSRIYWRGRFFHYPLQPASTLTSLGVVTSAAVVGSYLWAKLFPVTPEVSFEDWISNRFGRRLFEIFFKSYTEKVWGMPCSRIGADWAAQRIKGLSLGTAITNMLIGNGGRTSAITSLIDRFYYPRLGPGMMWEAFRDRITAGGGAIRLNTSVVEILHDAGHIHTVVAEQDGVRTCQPVRHVISTMAICDLVTAVRPAPPARVREAAEQLRYRDFVTVALIVRDPDVFPDNWIYVHDPRVRTGRIQNFKNWSPDMVPDAASTCLGLEYFCSEGDELWRLSDAEFVALATREIAAIGLVAADRVADGTVVRVRKAYPVYDEAYAEALRVVREWVAGFDNLQLVGRNGMHKYNNQDHSMVTASLAVENLFGERHDLWSINADEEYHEVVSGNGNGSELRRQLADLARTQPLVPMALGDTPPRTANDEEARGRANLV